MATSREATGGVITVDEDANDDDEIIDGHIAKSRAYIPSLETSRH